MRSVLKATQLLAWPSAVALLLVLAPTAGGELALRTLGSAGDLYRVHAGLHSDLFAGDTETEIPILILEVDRRDQEPIQLLVPGTDDPRAENDARLVYEPSADSVTVLWQSQGDDGLIAIRFATFDGSESQWSEVYELAGEEGAAILAQTPRVAVTRDTYELELADELITAERSILHLLWRDTAEVPTTFYSPIIFVEGRYIGWHESFAMSSFFLDAAQGDEDSDEQTDDGEDSDEVTATLTTELARASSLRVSHDNQSIVVAFTNPESNRLGALEIRVLPLELSLLGDQVHQAIFELAELYDPDDISSLADGMRAHVVIIGLQYSFNPSVVDYVSEQVGDWLLEAGGAYGWAGLEDLADDARDFTIDISSEIYATTISDPSDPDSQIVQIDIGEFLEGLEGPQPAQLLDIRVRSDLAAPDIGDGPTVIHTSLDGRDLLIAWEDEELGQIHWVESHRRSEDGAWTEPLSLVLDDRLSRNEAHRLLERKIR